MSWGALGGRWAAEVVHRVVYRTHGIIRPVSYETKCGLPPQRWTDADVLTDYDSDVTCQECNRLTAKEPGRRRNGQSGQDPP